MEDIALSKRLKRLSRPLCLTARVTTSGRRWDERGVIRTILLMWRLRLAYFLGASPATLARRYGYAPRDDRSRDAQAASARDDHQRRDDARRRAAAPSGTRRRSARRTARWFRAAPRRCAIGATVIAQIAML